MFTSTPGADRGRAGGAVVCAGCGWAGGGQLGGASGLIDCLRAAFDQPSCSGDSHQSQGNAVGGQGKAVDRQWKGSERSRKGRVMADLVAPRSLNPLVGLLEISLGQLRKICTRPRTQSEGAAGGASAVGCRRRWAFHWLDYAIMLSMCEVAQWTELKDSLVSQPFQSLHHQQQQQQQHQHQHHHNVHHLWQPSDSLASRSAFGSRATLRQDGSRHGATTAASQKRGTVLASGKAAET